jgi:hypothetical protein
MLGKGAAGTIMTAVTVGPPQESSAATDTSTMDASVSKRSWNFNTPIPHRWAAVLAYSMVVLVFLGDWFSPTSVVIDVAYEAPVVFAALKGSRQLTIMTVLLGSIAIFLGWFMDLAQASFAFSEDRIENRLLSMVSLLIVGSLAIVIQRNAQRAGHLEAERALLREEKLSLAVGRVMAALSTGSTITAITGEAPNVLEASAAVWCPTQHDGTFWLTMGGDDEVKPLYVPRTANFESLLQRLCFQRSVQVVSAAETIDFLIGRSLGFQDALAIPVGDASTTLGIIFAAVDSTRIDHGTLLAAGNFARFACSAMQQARYVEELSRR